MSVKIYQSTDADAPLLTGEAGTLVTVLDKCLVEGFSTRSITSITRSGSVATATTSTVHGLAIGSAIPIRLLISGADQVEYNGEFLVTPLTTSTFSYQVMGTPTTPATGSITSKRPGLGWSKAFAGTSKAAYQMPLGTTKHFLQVLDNLTGTSQRSAKIRGHESMSDVDTGVGLFPTAAQLSDGLWVYKSSTQNSTARKWRLIGDEAGFYLIVYPFNNSGAVSVTSWFGDIESYKVGDEYRSSIIAGTSQLTSTNYNDNGSGALPFGDEMSTSISAGSLNGHYLSRSYTQVGGAVGFGKLSELQNMDRLGYNSSMPYPSPIDNGYYVARIRLVTNSAFRGVLPGVFQPLQGNVFSDADVVSDLVGLPGRSLLIVLMAIRFDSNTARGAFDLTGPWQR